MPSFTLRAVIARPPEAVFAVLSDPSNVPALFEGAHPDTVLDAGPLRAGSRLRRSRTVQGTNVTGEATVEVHRPPRELAIVGEARGVRVETRWRLVPEGEGGGSTKVEYECRVAASGLASLVVGAVVEALQRADADHLDRLGKLVLQR